MAPKIFCTGWQRTGTTSLNHALATLNIAVIQFPWQLLDDPAHPVLDEYQAFCDNPIPLMYKDLDRRYPGSRFIHTQRSDESWLKSAEWLMTVGEKKFGFDKIEKGYEMFDRMYGTRQFDPEVFLDRYRRHNQEVRAYFAGREGDVLYLDITAGEGFEKICPFLGMPVPTEAFPHKNYKEPLWRGRLRQLGRKVKRRIIGER